MKKTAVEAKPAAEPEPQPEEMSEELADATIEMMVDYSQFLAARLRVECDVKTAVALIGEFFDMYTKGGTA